MEKSIKGHTVLFDLEDEWIINGYNWTIASTGRYKYVQTTTADKHTIMLHRLLMKPSQDKVIDHINRNGLDNRKSNLRICNRAENNRNSKSKNPFGYKGVFQTSFSRKYSARICSNGIATHIGTFDTPEEAAKAFDRKAIELGFNTMQLNFPI